VEIDLLVTESKGMPAGNDDRFHPEDVLVERS
jgi:hypothetical protein